MNATAIALLGLVYSFSPVEVEAGVVDFHLREFHIPCQLDENIKDKVLQICLYYSTDRGKTWQIDKNHPPITNRFKFAAPSDGLYWFAPQLVFKDGTSNPKQNAPLEPALKVYVNSQRRVLRYLSDPRIIEPK